MNVRIIDGEPFLRPCRSIPSDGNENNEYVASLTTIHERITTVMPMAGGAALVPTRIGGEPRLAAQLRAEAPWMGSAIDYIADQAAVSLWAGQPWLALRPLLLVGPAGAGKTHFARRLGALSGCGDALLSLAGVSSNSELAGNPRGFKHAQPCFPVLAMERLNVANPVIIIDEVEKSRGGDGMGDPVATLFAMIERSTAAQYFDGCLAAEVDLSHVNWMMTANTTVGLPAPLLSRVKVVEVDGPAPEHAEAVLGTLWRDVAAESGLPPANLPRLERAAETMLIKLFRRTRSVRRLKRAIASVVAVSIRHHGRELH